MLGDGARLSGVQGVKTINRLKAVDAGVLPRRSIMYGPLDLELEIPPPAEGTEVQDLIHMVFHFAIDLYRGWRVGPLSREWVIGSMFQ